MRNIFPPWAALVAEPALNAIWRSDTAPVAPSAHSPQALGGN